MEICMRCGAEENEVRLFDAIYEGRMGSMCERCSVIENIPIIRKPNSTQIKEAEKTTKVYQRMRNLAGMYDRKREETFFPEDRIKELDSKPELEMPERKQLNLIDHYYWEIMRIRRRRGYSQKQLAEAIGESEVVIDMIEKGKLPENANSVITKLEQIFQRKFRKITETERILNEKRGKPVLLDVEGNELEIIPEEIVIQKEEPKKIKGVGDYYRDFLNKRNNKREEKNIPVKEELEEIKEKDDSDSRLGMKNPNADFNIRAVDKNSVSIKDLKEIHKRKVDTLKQDKILEQKNIEQHKMLVEARKEELRMKREKESRELDNLLGGKELVDKKKE